MMISMKAWIRERGLFLTNIVLFLVFSVGMVIAGFQVYNADRGDHGQAAAGLLAYLSSGEFLGATFENWESEFLQMGRYVVLTAYLLRKDSSESKPLGRPAPQDQDPRTDRDRPRAPWPVRRGGWVLKLYENSLSIRFFALFAGSVLLHAVGGASSGSNPCRTGKVSSWPSR